MKNFVANFTDGSCGKKLNFPKFLYAEEKELNFLVNSYTDPQIKHNVSCDVTRVCKKLHSGKLR